MPRGSTPLRTTGFLLAAGASAWLVYLLADAPRAGAVSADSPTQARGLARGLARGRSARAPSDIPIKGWKDIIVRTYNEAMDDRIATVAAGITFYSLLALFPAVTVLVSLYGLFADPATVRDHMFALSFMLPSGTFQIVEDQIGRIVSEGQAALTVKLAFGLAVAVWGANAGMKALIDGLNIAYEEPERRGFVALNLLSLALTASAIAVVLGALATATLAPALLSATRLSDVATTALELLRWPLMFVVLVGALSVIYRFGPSRQSAKWRWVTWGSAFAALLWIAVSVGLSAYLANFADYNKTYGSLGAAVALMTWIWLSSCAVLVGAELNAELEHQTAVDTTTGPPQPMGLRGARMADTLGGAAAASR